MSVAIKAANIVKDDANISSIGLGSQAARQAVTDSGLNAADIGLLINIGTYRDENLLEPAEAALMQQAMDLNGDSRRQVETDDDSLKFEAAPTTLSFDVLGGACGFYNALEILSAFAKNETVKSSLIISANAHPSQKKQPDFPFTAFGSAMVLSATDNGLGFSDIQNYTSDSDKPGITSYFDADDHNGEGREKLWLHIDDDFEESLTAFATQCGRSYLAERNLYGDEFDYIIGSEPSAGFLETIATNLGLDPKLCISSFDNWGDAHSSAPILAFSRNPELLKPGKRGLIIGAGSGLTCYLAQYYS